MGGEVVIDHQHIPPGAHPLLSQGAARKGCEELESGRGRGLGNHDARDVEHPGLTQGLDGGNNRGAFLADQHIDAQDIAVLLGNDRVDGERALAGSRITDDELALAFADGDHGVHHLVAAEQGALDEIPRSDGR